MSKGRSWIDQVTGSMEKWPEFDEVIRLGREFRQSQCDDAATASGGV
jgi:hypothetical protein